MISSVVGMPRRYAQFTEYQFLAGLSPLVKLVSIAAIASAIVQISFYFNLVWSMFKGEKAGDNPWEATTLEWSAPSPPGHGNFLTEPIVYRGPYEYSVPGAAKDFTPQFEPERA